MEIRELLRDVIRFSWEAVANPRGLHGVILRNLQEENQLDPIFKRPALNLQPIALPTLMGLMQTKDFELLADNSWKKLSQERQKQIQDFYVLHEDHTMLYHMTDRSSQIEKLASYMAATYAFTTEKCPYIIPFERVVQGLIFDDENEEIEFCRKVGLLIVTNVNGIHRGLLKISGTVRAFFFERMRNGSMTVFLDPILPAIAEIGEKGEEPTRKQIRLALEASAIGAVLPIVHLLVDLSVYMNFNTVEPIRSLNELGENYII